MIPQNMMMSRNAREILNSLEIMAGQYNISTIVTPSQIYITDQIVQKYHTAPIINTIKSKIKSIKNHSSKHFTVEHWVSMLNTVFGGNMGVRREDSRVLNVDGNDIGYSGFCMISKYLIIDYSIMDASIIYDIIHTYNDSMISNAIKSALSNNVYNIQYIKTILEKEQALSNIKGKEIDKLRERVSNSNLALNKEKVNHSIIDIAVSQYNWEKIKENTDLEIKMQEILKKGGI